MSTLKGLAVATALAGMMFSGGALAEDDGSTTSVTEEGSVENLPDGSTVTTSTVTSITDTPVPNKEFGGAGDIVFGVERLGGFTYAKMIPEDSDGNKRFDDNPSEINFTLFIGGEKNTFNAGLVLPRFTLDYFVIDHLSIGGGVIAGVRNDKIPENTLLGPSPEANLKELAFGALFKVGYALNLSDWVSLWPRVGLEFLWDRKREEVTSDNTITFETAFTGLWLMVDAPFVFELFSGFGLTVAPTFDFPLVGNVTTKAVETPGGGLVDQPDTKVKIMQIGGFLGVLGYW